MGESEIQEIYNLVVGVLNRKRDLEVSIESRLSLLVKYRDAASEGRREMIFQKVLDCLANILFNVVAK